MKRTCETEGCNNRVRRRQTRCDDCIVAEARRRQRERETTESGVRGGQGRSGPRCGGQRGHRRGGHSADGPDADGAGPLQGLRRRE